MCRQAASSPAARPSDTLQSKSRPLFMPKQSSQVWNGPTQALPSVPRATEGLSLESSEQGAAQPENLEVQLLLSCFSWSRNECAN